MLTAYVVVALLAIAANGFSGVAALVHWKQILPGMARAGVPESWLATPGVLKTAGATGLLLGLIGVPLLAPPNVALTDDVAATVRHVPPLVLAVAVPSVPVVV